MLQVSKIFSRIKKIALFDTETKGNLFHKNAKVEFKSRRPFHTPVSGPPVFLSKGPGHNVSHRL
jgi:hypothetical protein